MKLWVVSAHELPLSVVKEISEMEHQLVPI